MSLFTVSEGKSTAVTYSCKYFEVSSLMNLQVDTLLAGLLNQIRLRKSNTSAPYEPHPHCIQDCGVKSPMSLLGRMLRPAMLKRQQSKSCDNLLVLWMGIVVFVRRGCKIVIFKIYCIYLFIKVWRNYSYGCDNCFNNC